MILTEFFIREWWSANSNKKASIWYSKTKNKREDYNTLETAEKSLLYFIYYLYNGLYDYFIFIKATFKFIGIMVTVLAKGLLGMLGPFYSNNKSAKKEEENK